MLTKFLALLALLLVSRSLTPQPAGADQLTVYLIPHSHDDVGWLKTPDDYFYGGDQNTQWAGVQYTLDSIVIELSVNTQLKFSIVEIAFLDMWWRSANETMRNLMTDFVKKGRIEFLNAGWCMSDEATVYYEDMVDQMSLGLKWIKDQFNVVPTVGWQLDPFGHQASFATLGHQFGFNSLFFGRIHYEDKNVREAKKSMEIVWKPPQVSGNVDGLLAHTMYYGYNSPPGFCFDRVCLDEPIKSDPTLEGYNVHLKAQAFVNYFRNMSNWYKSSHLLHALGSDFQWSNARMWTLNMGRLMNYINSKSEFGVTLKYATPKEYIEAIYNQSNRYPTKTDDFFPYADYTDAYWSGYFTSRVGIKGFVRDTGRWLQAIRTKLALLKLSNQSQYLNSHLSESETLLTSIEKQMGMLQHHDAVSGTEKQKVNDQYIRVASKSKVNLIDFYNNIIKEQTNDIIGQAPSEVYRTNWNETQKEWGISFPSDKNVLLQLYNPGPEGEYPIRVKIAPRNMSIKGVNNQNIKGDLICGNVQDSNDCELFFNLHIKETSWGFVKLEPVGQSGSVTLVPMKELSAVSPTKEIHLSSTASVKIHRNEQKFDLHIPSGTHTFSLAYNYYQSYQDSGQKSGAYIFRPSPGTKNSSKKYSSLKSLHYSEGQRVLVVSLVEDKTSTKLYFSKTDGYVESYGIEIQTFIDSINISDHQGKEIVLDINTGYNNNKTFYTDSNGLEEQKRVLDHMPTWNITVHQPVAANYYPINSHIKIKDGSKTVSVLVDRARGGAVIKNGVIELMIHRRTLYDDDRGVGEPLNETDSSGKGLTQIVRNYLLFGQNNRGLQKRLDQCIQVTWSNTNNATFQRYDEKSVFLRVPKEVKLWMRHNPDNSYLLRVQLLDSSVGSANVEIPDGLELSQLTLGANQLLEEWKQRQYQWKEDNQGSTKLGFMKNRLIREPHRLQSDTGSSVSLKPLEIRTFSLKN